LAPIVHSIGASNGVFHVINEVLRPNWVFNPIFGFVATMEDMSILFELLRLVELGATLNSIGDEFTLVAPTNDAFRALGDVVLDSLRQPENQQALFNILEYHIITGVFAELEVGVDLPTEQGGSIEVSKSIDFMFNQASVVSSGSILANNGALYKIDAVLNPDSVVGF
jgi:uncharacterized surface protein with fasciclin (FAS1) repeats